MWFSWDEGKRRENWQRRKVDLLEAALIFEDPEVVESVDDRDDYGEQRIQALGQVGGSFCLVAYIWRDGIRHLITAWKVGEHGGRRYQAILARPDQADARPWADERDPG